MIIVTAEIIRPLVVDRLTTHLLLYPILFCPTNLTFQPIIKLRKLLTNYLFTQYYTT